MSYKLKIQAPQIEEMGLTSTFASKRAFANSNTSDKIKEGNISGTLVITYAQGYKNEFPFNDYKELMVALNAGTEKELVNEFSTTKKG